MFGNKPSYVIILVTRNMKDGNNGNQITNDYSYLLK
jgi:hypothetical protein